MFEGNHISAGLVPGGEGKALRAFGWAELAARINAANDLREVLRRDNTAFIASFSDAAAGFFADEGQGKPNVNPDALCDRKSSGIMDDDAEGDPTTGDREI
jgi:hypothetical protein